MANAVVHHLPSAFSGLNSGSISTALVPPFDKIGSPSSLLLSNMKLMPTILEKDGFIFFFYSNDDRPIHVHVRRGGGEAVFNVEDGA
jgi:hypothetical protein